MTDKEQLRSYTADHIQGPHSPPEDELRLIDLLETLFRKRVLVIMVVSIFTLTSIFYAQSITPSYRATIGFLPPSNISLTTYFNVFKALSIEPKNLSREIQEEKRKLLFLDFSNTFLSHHFQKKVFIEGNFLKRFAGNEPDANIKKADLDQFSQFIRINRVGNFDESSLLNTTTYFEMTGTKPEVMSSFLNSLAYAAIKETTINIKESLEQKINSQANLYSTKLELLRFQSKENSLKQVRYLSEQLEIAKNLGVLENNLTGSITNTPFWVFTSKYDMPFMPLWYLYGQRALEQKLAVIKSRPHLDQGIEGTHELIFKIKNLSQIDMSQNFSKPIIINDLSIAPTNFSIIAIITTGAVLGLIAGIVLAFLSIALDPIRARSKSVTLT
jgi:chain length determinant protein (polysaccharide antigen chain regulator)